jgi:hypothetical protein
MKKIKGLMQRDQERKVTDSAWAASSTGHVFDIVCPLQAATCTVAQSSSTI